jgi:hypothetical protein
LAGNPDILKSVKPLKRAGIKPRVLFPTRGDTANEEEDVTDVEDCEPMSPTPAPLPSIMHSAPMLGSSRQFEPSPLMYTPELPPASTLDVPALNLQGPGGGPVNPTSAFTASGLTFHVGPASGDELEPQAEAEPQTTFRDSPGSSLLKYWPVSTKRRDIETRADRTKRLREAGGSPVPRTRKAHAAAAAEALAARAPTTEASTSDA